MKYEDLDVTGTAAGRADWVRWLWNVLMLFSVVEALYSILTFPVAVILLEMLLDAGFSQEPLGVWLLLLLLLLFQLWLVVKPYSCFKWQSVTSSRLRMVGVLGYVFLTVVEMFILVYAFPPVID